MKFIARFGVDFVFVIANVEEIIFFNFTSTQAAFIWEFKFSFFGLILAKILPPFREGEATGI
jgi:hypothetical protein